MATSTPEVSNPKNSTPPPHYTAEEQLNRKQWLYRSVFTIVVGVIAIFVGVFGYNKLASFAIDPPTRDPVPLSLSVEVFNVEESSIQEIVIGFGSARADKEVTLAAQVAGEIIETEKLEIGEFVQGERIITSENGPSVQKKGEVLVKIDPRTYKQRVQQNEDRISEIDAELIRLKQEETNMERKMLGRKEDYKTFKREYEKIKRLNDLGTASDGELSTAILDLRKYEDSIIQMETDQALLPSRKEILLKKKKSLQNDLELSKIDLKRTEVVPPFSGYLGEILVEKGQFVRAGDPMFKLTDRSIVEVPIPVSLQDYASIVAEIKTGKTPQVILKSNEESERSWDGTLVRYAPQADERTRTVNVYVEVENDEQEIELLPGTFTIAQIGGEEYHDVVVVPRSAIVEGQIFIIEKAADAETKIRSVTKKVVKVRHFLQSLAILDTQLEPGVQVVTTNLDLISKLIMNNEQFQVVVVDQRNLNIEDSEQQIRRWKILSNESSDSKQ